MIATSIKVEDWGVIEYGEALARQRARHKALIAGDVEDTLILCQHPAVITCGTSSRKESIVSNQEALKKQRIDYFQIERGGDVTYHGPGQLVAYPMINLHHYKTDIGWYMRSLEQCIIDVLLNFSVTAHRIDGKAGVWTSQNCKIASIGVKLSRWCSMHGAAINVLRESVAGFEHIIPCGLDGVTTTSVEHESGNAVSLADFQTSFVIKFQKHFNNSKVNPDS